MLQILIITNFNNIQNFIKIFYHTCNNCLKSLAISMIFKILLKYFIIPVIQWVVYCNKTFQSNGYSHKDWACNCNLRKRVQYIREKHYVHVRCKMKLFSKTFQDAAKELKKDQTDFFNHEYGKIFVNQLGMSCDIVSWGIFISKTKNLTEIWYQICFGLLTPFFQSLEN